ncbi:hypothetical protein [Sphingomonas profundi]|uniref:hypothetical protein n=1 Tax=Alterirhizorhabdus profundi TaxID=2681549 RepID=UPI0012E73DE4|nr:hypothetical protein [Sphingomonas profundi]
MAGNYHCVVILVVNAPITLFLVSHDPLLCARVASAAGDAWRVVHSAEEGTGAALVLIGDDGCPPISGSAPLIRIGGGAPADERLPAGYTDADLADALRRWHPGDVMAGARRLAGLFGQEALAGMVAALRAQLADAVARFDAANGAEGDGGLAHRIAGVAGTLGFAEVGRHWLALSEGDAGAWPDARRTARIAIAAIDREASARAAPSPAAP